MTDKEKVLARWPEAWRGSHGIWNGTGSKWLALGADWLEAARHPSVASQQEVVANTPETRDAVRYMGEQAFQSGQPVSAVPEYGWEQLRASWRLGWKRAQARAGTDPSVASQQGCEYCGPTCYGGAAHNARKEDGARKLPSQQVERVERPEPLAAWDHNGPYPVYLREDADAYMDYLESENARLRGEQ